MSNMKKESQVDITKDLKPGGEKYKNPATVEKLDINPKQDAFAVSPKVQQEKVKIEVPISEGANIPDAAIKPVKAAINWFRKKADDITGKGKTEDPNAAGYKDPGQKEKLQFPTKTDAMPSVKQPGLEKSEDAGSKQFKDPGNKEHLEVPTGKTDVPNIERVVDVDKKIGSEYKDEGEKEKLKINPKYDTVSTSQEKVKIEVPRAGEERAQPMHKQFGQIDWMKKQATSEEAQEWISNKIKLLVGEGKDQEQASAIAYSMAREKGFDVPAKKASKRISADMAEMLTTLNKFASECPECFKNLVLRVASEQP